MDVGEDATAGDSGFAQKSVEFLIVADGELDVARDDALLLVVTGGVASELEDLSGEVLEDSGEVHRGTSADAGGVAADTEVTVHAADGELEASLSGAGGGFAGFLAAGHVR